MSNQKRTFSSGIFQLTSRFWPHKNYIIITQIGTGTMRIFQLPSLGFMIVPTSLYLFSKPLYNTKWKQTVNLKYNQVLHFSQVALCLPLPLTMTHPAPSNAHTYFSEKFIAWFRKALSIGKLHSIKKSIYIPIDCEKNFPWNLMRWPPESE